MDPVRLVSHLAAELPFLVLCGVGLSSGWRPTSDDALFSWRAWNVLTSHPTLLGAPTHGITGGGPTVFAPGPLLSWLLAIPVHLDPMHGALWGSALIGAAGAAVAIEAGRVAAGRWGMVLCAGSVLMLANTQVGVVLNPLWTPWIGAVWFLATLAAAWATGCGRLAWWVVVVCSASLAAQAHVIYAPAVLGLCVLSALLGGAVGRRSPSAAGPRHWVGRGLLCAALLWLPTLVQQLAGNPGNLTLLWRSTHQPGGRLGLSLALRGLSSATRFPSSWAHRMPNLTMSSFLQIGGIAFGGSARWGGAVVLVLLAVGGLAIGRRATRLAVAAWTAATAGLLTVLAMASVPSADALEINYLNVAFVPVGIMTWLVMAAGALEVSRAGRSALRSRAGAGTGREDRHGSEAPTMSGWAAGSAALVLVVASALAMASIGSLVPSDQSELGGPATVRATATATRMVAGEVPSSVSFQLDVLGGPSSAFALAVQWGTAYALFVTGRTVRLDSRLAPSVGQPPGSATPSLTRVAVELDRQGRVTAVRTRSPGRARSAAAAG